jgi:hypothetical protein
VCVAERVFHEQDEDWAACMAEFARATKHIHARVGYAQGPQVPDPRAPEYQAALVAHERWWDQILGALSRGSGAASAPQPLASPFIDFIARSSHCTTTAHTPRSRASRAGHHGHDAGARARHGRLPEPPALHAGGDGLHLGH